MNPQYFCFVLAVVCDEKEIPPFISGTVVGTIDVEAKKEADPESWNTFERRLTYTCPIGYVVERSGGDYSEQQDPIPEDQESFEVECAADSAWTPRPIQGGTIMPECIRKMQIMRGYMRYNPLNFSHKLHRAAICCA